MAWVRSRSASLNALVRWSANFVFVPVRSDSIPLLTSLLLGLIAQAAGMKPIPCAHTLAGAAAARHRHARMAASHFTVMLTPWIWRPTPRRRAARPGRPRAAAGQAREPPREHRRTPV